MITILDSKPSDVWVVSASQVTTWNRCQRRWGFRYIDGLPDPPGRGAIFGLGVHKQFERYFGNAIYPDATTREGRLALRALEAKLYPDRTNQSIEVESHFVFECDGVVFQGYVDLKWEDSQSYIITINDHKTSSDPEKYGLTDRTLPTDVQATIYALWGLYKYERDVLRLQWSYMQTSPPSRERKNPKCYAVRAEVGRAHVEKQFRLKVLGTAKEITKAKETATTGNELEPDPTSCNDFGKACAFADHCTLNRQQKLTTVFGKEEATMTETLKEMLARKRAAGGKLPPPRVNSPEHKAGVEAAQEVSKAVGQATGGRAAQQATARNIANATADETDPAAAKAKAEAALGVAEADRSAKTAASMSRNDVLLAMFYADRSVGLRVSHSKPKATATAPYVAGRTASSMVKATLITSRDNDDGTKTLCLTGVGLEEAEKLVKPTLSDAAQPSRTNTDGTPTTSRVPQPAPKPAKAEELLEPRSNQAEALVTPDAPLVARKVESQVWTVDIAVHSHAEFFRSLLSHTEIETDDAVKKFDAYLRHFPMRGV